MNDYTHPTHPPAAGGGDPQSGQLYDPAAYGTPPPPADPAAYGQPPADHWPQHAEPQAAQPVSQPEPQFAGDATAYAAPQPQFTPQPSWPTPPADFAAQNEPAPQFAAPTPPPQFAGDPAAGLAAQQPFGQPTPPPPTGQPPTTGTSPLQSEDELSEDQFITGGDDHSFITSVPVPPHPQTQFNEPEFLALLAGSISLTKTEKQRIIASIPNLSQYQIDELTRIFREEKKKFEELNNKHSDQLKQLEEQHKNDWNDIEMQAKQDAKKKDDEDAAAALRRQLGLE